MAGSLPRISGTLEIHCEGVIFFAWLATMMMEPRFPLSIHLHPKRGDHHLQGGIPLCPHNSSYAEVSTYNLAYINLHIYILYPHLFSYRQFFFLRTSGTSGQSHDMTHIFRSFSLEPATVPVPRRNASGDHRGHELKTNRSKLSWLFAALSYSWLWPTISSISLVGMASCGPCCYDKCWQVDK